MKIDRRFALLYRIGWCEWRDSNSHRATYWNLNPARLPISPHSQFNERTIIDNTFKHNKQNT